MSRTAVLLGAHAAGRRLIHTAVTTNVIIVFRLLSLEVISFAI